MSFPDRLAADHRVTAYLSRSAIDGLLDPGQHTRIFQRGLRMEQVEVARRFADEVHAHPQFVDERAFLRRKLAHV